MFWLSPIGKRPWRKDLYLRYMGVVNSNDSGVDSELKRPPQLAVVSCLKVGAGRGTRTHTSVKIADFKSAASTIPPSRHFGLG